MGDPPGFVQVLDDQTLARPDRLGNHRDRHIHAEWPCGSDVPRQILTIEDDTPEDAEPVTDEYVALAEPLIDHPRLTVMADGHHVRIEGNVRLSLYDVRELARNLIQHLEAHGHRV